MKCLEENKKTGYRKAVNMKVGIIGMGNMGAKYALMIAKGDVKGMELAAITRVTDERWDMIRQYVSPELMKFNSSDDMYAAIDDNSLSVDAVIIVTPHYSHEELVKKAFERGISVLCDKPAGVYSRQARSMWEAYQSAKKSCPKLQYGFIFMGIDGVMYAGPIADAAAAIVCGYFTIRELKELKNLEKSLEAAVI